MQLEKIWIPIDFGFMAALLGKQKDIDIQGTMPKVEDFVGKKIFAKLE